MGRYVLSVICAALICGITLSFFREGPAQAAVRMLCGIFLTAVVVGPLAGFDPEADMRFLIPEAREAEELTAAGEKLARQAMETVIKDRAETYILDKAGVLPEGVTVDIGLSDDPMPIPAEALVTGRLSPHAKDQIGRILHRDLGIPKEKVRWTG